MPPEPPPWDRRDFYFREKKHDKLSPYHDATGSGSSFPRWRDSFHSSREFPTPSPRRPPPGYYRHGGSGGGYNSLFPDEPYSRSEDDGFRTYQSGRFCGNSNRSSNNRESGGFFRRSSWDAGDFSRQHHDSVVSQRSVVASQPRPSLHLSSSDERHDKASAGVDDVSRTGNKHERDQDHSLGSLQWRPLKWNRPGSVSSSSKVVRSEPEDGRVEVLVPTGTNTPVESPVTSPLSSDEGLLRKRQRLGWGQGLAKYEKEKFVGTDDGGRKGSSVKSSSVESPKRIALPGSASPATPGSMNCSSFHGGEDKDFPRAVQNDDLSNLNNSPCNDSQHSLENFGTNSEQLDLHSLNNISSLLANLLHFEDIYSANSQSHFMQQTAVSKLMLLKGNILRHLEKTELEIDLLENELKKLKSVSGRSEADESSHKSNCSKENASVAPKVPCSAFELASAVAQLTSDGITSKLQGVVNEQADFNPHAAESQTCSSPRENETLSFDTPKAVLKRGATLDSDHIISFANQSETDGVSGNAAALDVVKGDDDVYPSTKCAPEFHSLIALIMASNRDCAKRASEILDVSLSANSTSSHAFNSCDYLITKQEGSLIRNKFAMSKRFLRFKERALALKYKVFQHLWKEDLRLLSLRKHRSKSQKRLDQACRSSQNFPHKNRSLRSRFALSGSLTLVSTSEILDFTSKLLSDTHIKVYRNNLRMPALILDEREWKYSRFVSNNGLIEDPCSYEEEKSMINPWTAEEQEIFMELLATYGKDFAKIASFVNHKTTADCVEFYYKNHKSESFNKVKGSLCIRKNFQVNPSINYLTSSGKNRNREANAVSLDVLGTSSIIALQGDDRLRVEPRYSGRSNTGGHHDGMVPHGTSAAFVSSSAIPDQETSAGDVLAGLCGALSSEAMSSCVTTSFDLGDKLSSVTPDRQLAYEVSQIVDEDTCSDEGYGEPESVDWTDEEKSTFISALSRYGRDFSRISQCVGSRSEDHCKIFFSKARKSLGLDAILRGSSSDANIGKSDAEDACMFEIDSAICSTTQSCSKVDADFSLSTANESSAGSDQVEDVQRQIDADLSSQEKVVIEAGLVSILSVDHAMSGGEGNFCSSSEAGAARVDISTVSVQHDLGADPHLGVDREKNVGSSGESVSMNGVKMERIDGTSNDVGSSGESVSMKGVKMERIDGTSNDVGSSGASVSMKGVKVERIDGNSNEYPLVGSEKSLISDCFKTGISLMRSLLPKEVDDGPQSQTCLPVEKFSRHSNFSSDICSIDNSTCPDNQEQKMKSTLAMNILHRNPLAEEYEVYGQAATVRQSTVNSQDHHRAYEQQNTSASKDTYRQYLSGQRTVRHSSVLKGYPVHVLKQEMNKQAQGICGESVLVHDCPNRRDGMQSTESGICGESVLVRDCPNRRDGMQSTESPLQNSNEFSFLPKDNERRDGQRRPCLRDSFRAPVEQSVRTGDVKLFGQILTHPSSIRDSNKPCGSHQDPSLNLLSSHSDGALLPSIAERSHRRSRQEMPGRDRGTWADNGAQPGLLALPEAGTFLAKYPGSGVSCYTVKDHPGCCGFVQQAFLNPLTLDGNLGDGSLDLQKNNGFESASGFQHQGRLTLGMSGNGMLVGSKGCTGVSDPVAALKMHYASRASALRREDESWRTDIGR